MIIIPNVTTEKKEICKNYEHVSSLNLKNVFTSGIFFCQNEYSVVIGASQHKNNINFFSCDVILLPSWKYDDNSIPLLNNVMSCYCHVIIRRH